MNFDELKIIILKELEENIKEINRRLKLPISIKKKEKYFKYLIKFINHKNEL